MASVYKCDRCNRYFDKKAENDIGYYTVLKTVEVKEESPLHCKKEVDLCFQCELELDQFMSRKIFTPNEVEMAVRVYGQADRNVAMGEVIKYSPSEISKILRECEIKDGGDNNE